MALAPLATHQAPRCLLSSSISLVAGFLLVHHFLSSSSTRCVALDRQPRGR
uniref:Uncharacterized protein n=1 Tax=Arundo donax TaxID=35708 RepID=A0A0A9B839_ARUDO